jgi:hypothetical protein
MNKNLNQYNEETIRKIKEEGYKPSNLNCNVNELLSQYSSIYSPSLTVENSFPLEVSPAL